MKTEGTTKGRQRDDIGTTFRHFDERQKPFKGRKNVKNRRLRRFFDFLCRLPNPKSRQNVKGGQPPALQGESACRASPLPLGLLPPLLPKHCSNPIYWPRSPKVGGLNPPREAHRPSGLPGTYPQGAQILHKAFNGLRTGKRPARRSPRPGGHRDPLTSGLYCQACAPLRSLSDTAHPVSPSDRNAPTVPKS